MYRSKRTWVADDGRTCAGCKLQPGSSATSSQKGFKRCSACKKAWYCSPGCQKDDWVRHIFDCDTNQEITAAHHLALAVRDKSLPTDHATLVEYGFTRAPTEHAKLQLLGVYVDLMERHQVTTKKIHRWVSEGDLAYYIQATFTKLPDVSRGSHYAWLSKNMFVLDTFLPVLELEPALSTSTLNNARNAQRRRCDGCHSIAGDTTDDQEWHAQGMGRFAAYKQCGGCKKVWYCSPSCQKDSWVHHIFECKPRQPINTAHYLALAVRNNLLPEDPQTCDDYGFTKAFTTEARSKLLGVYIGLIERMDIPPRKVHIWRIEGRLLREIKAAFETMLPPGARGGYYPWLLDNQHLLDESVPDPRSDPIVEMINRGLKYANMRLLPPNETTDGLQRRLSELPKAQTECLMFAAKLLSKAHPSPHDGPQYMAFGFCACTCEEEESILGRRWQELLSKSTFKELCQAYDSGSTLSLFKTKKILVPTPTIEEFLKGSNSLYSVWKLKQFVLGTDDSVLRAARSVWVDYGFINCASDAERLDLKSIYKSVFQSTKYPTMDPLELHQACISGKLFDFVGQFYTFKEKKRNKYIRLFENPYPLPDL
ncbi:hypothetical protein PTI98_012435 [Pleurotus ostreatus]|nr:hypothetical protein PTI98_012435 [Pleurotus ostreatus]